ncbi:MAG: SDR family NAD(P)-dependent oxidoreductase [Candidatus Lokiarchaeia archaeon]
MKEFSEQRLGGRIVLITGGGSGIGRAISVRYAKEGADIIVNDINLEGANETAKMIRELGRKAMVIKADVGNSGEVEAMIEKVYNEWGRLDILLNNAGISGMPYILIEQTEEDWDRVMNTNLKGTWLCSKFAAIRMLEQEVKFGELRGKIINTASIAGKTATALIGAYSASKFGVIALTQVLAKELAPDITVNAICPGFHVTAIYLNSEEVVRESMKTFKSPEILRGRLGTADDVAPLAAFLASTDSDYMTGQAINIDGGVEFH